MPTPRKALPELIHFSPRLWGLDMKYKEQIEWLRGFEIDHSPDGWPAIRMREISAMCDAVESLLAENERLKHNLTTTLCVATQEK